MQKQLVLILLTCFTVSLYAQPQTIIGNSFITTLDNMVVYGVDAKGTLDESKPFKVSKGAKFNVNGFDAGNNVKITFWPYSTKIEQAKKVTLDIGYTIDYASGKEFVGAWANNKDFVMKLEVFNLGTKLYFGKRNDFTWGVMTLPIKARFGDKKDRFFDVEENLNLGFTFGLRHQIQGKREQSINYLVGVSIARVKTDSLSLKDSFPAPQSSVASALMFSGGILYQYESFQVGIFLGIDNVMGQLGRNWKFQSKPWIGIAIGVSLFSRNTTLSGTGSNSEK